MKTFVANLLKKLFGSDTNPISWTKIGGWTVVVLTAALANGMIPPEYVAIVKFLIAIAGGTAISGARDAITKK